MAPAFPSHQCFPAPLLHRATQLVHQWALLMPCHHHPWEVVPWASTSDCQCALFHPHGGFHSIALPGQKTMRARVCLTQRSTPDAAFGSSPPITFLLNLFIPYQRTPGQRRSTGALGITHQPPLQRLVSSDML